MRPGQVDATGALNETADPKGQAFLRSSMLDARLAWQATRKLTLSLVGQNLPRKYHAEYDYPSPAREQIARSVFARFTWND